MGSTAEKIARLIEQAMTQTGTDENAQKTVDEERVEELVLDFLLFVKFFNYQISQQQSYQPTERVPTDGDKTQTKGHLAGIPNDIEKVVHIFNKLGLHIEAEMHDVAVLHHIVLALDTQFSCFANGRL